MSVDYTAKIVYGYKMEAYEVDLLRSQLDPKIFDDLHDRYLHPINGYTNDTYWYFGTVIEDIEAGNFVDLSELNFNTVSTANVVLAYSSHCKIFLGEKIPSTYLLCQIS